MRTLIVGFVLLILGSTLAGWGAAGRLPLGFWTLTSLLVGTLGYGMVYLGIHALSQQRRVKQGWLILMPPALFTLAALITGFHIDDRMRSCLFHLQAAGFLAAAAWPVWRDRRVDPLPSRLPLAMVLAACALIFGLGAWAILERADYVDWIAHGFAFQILGNFGIAVLVCGFATDRAERGLRQVAEMDSLTGIGNRRWLEARLPTTIKAGDTLIVLDLDHFKQVNDRYGHAGGDAALVATACTLRETLRTEDLPARMGGEEFLLFLPGLGIQACVIAEDLRRRIEQQMVRHQDSIIRVTASLGVAMAARDNVGWEQLYQTADSALYEAKRRGRNRVVDHTAASIPAAAAPPASAGPGPRKAPGLRGPVRAGRPGPSP
ncbi:GGDEF domain-containing protein [Niveispirillum sp. KHB5.9]|uniref:GGDEF domain-containing protein n=1 Tax=Niveispirillum sp. KHB5.9 TaxID=3400269 RepID=UPI003A8A7EA1